jgi:excisionase family DNA binding protein
LEKIEIDLITIDELMELLKVKESKVRKMILKKEIKYIKIGSLIRFRGSDVSEYLDKNSVTIIEKDFHITGDLIV